MQAGPVIHSAITRHHHHQFRVLTILDLLGLFAVTVLLASVDQHIGSDSLYVTLFVVGLGVWLLSAQSRSLSTILEYSRGNPLWVPSFTVVVVLGIRLLTGEYASWSAALAFAGLWTICMGLARVLRYRLMPPIRILTIGTRGPLSDLENLPHATLICATTPPDDFSGFDVVALDPNANHTDEWLHWLMHADMAGAKLIAAPLVVETLTRQLPLEALNGKWAHFLVSARRPYTAWKRVADIVGVVLFAPLWLPILGLVALAVLIDDGRPVLFWQERMGRNRKPFYMAKVRSMVVGADAVGPRFADAQDTRITRVGRFLRRYRLDELPQFWNVLKGDMSIIGPRPEQVEFSADFEKRFALYSLRYSLRPGITGWAQVKQGYAADWHETYGKLRHDLYYARHLSIGFDAQILLRTIKVLLSGFGAR